MPIDWTSDNDARLLMAYIEATDAKLGTDGWKAIAEKLGGDATVGGISQRFTKVLKKKYGGANCALVSGGGGGGGKASASATPAKSPRNRKEKDAEKAEKTPSSSPRKRGAKGGAGDDDDDEVPDSPTKKLKSESFFDQDDEAENV